MSQSHTVEREEQGGWSWRTLILQEKVALRAEAELHLEIKRVQASFIHQRYIYSERCIFLGFFKQNFIKVSMKARKQGL